MRQASLKLKSYARSVSIVDSGNLQKRILYTMLWILLFLALFYVFSLGNMVFNILERKALEKHVSALSNEVGEMELEYLRLSQKIDLNFAHSLGFREAKTKFATRKTLGSLDSVKVSKNEI